MVRHMSTTMPVIRPLWPLVSCCIPCAATGSTRAAQPCCFHKPAGRAGQAIILHCCAKPCWNAVTIPSPCSPSMPQAQTPSPGCGQTRPCSGACCLACLRATCCKGSRCLQEPTNAPLARQKTACSTGCKPCCRLSARVTRQRCGRCCRALCATLPAYAPILPNGPALRWWAKFCSPTTQTPTTILWNRSGRRAASHCCPILPTLCSTACAMPCTTGGIRAAAPGRPLATTL